MLKIVSNQRRERIVKLRAKYWGVSHEEIKQNFLRVYSNNRNHERKAMTI